MKCFLKTFGQTLFGYDSGTYDVLRTTLTDNANASDAEIAIENLRPFSEFSALSPGSLSGRVAYKLYWSGCKPRWSTEPNLDCPGFHDKAGHPSSFSTHVRVSEKKTRIPRVLRWNIIRRPDPMSVSSAIKAYGHASSHLYGFSRY